MSVTAKTDAVERKLASKLRRARNRVGSSPLDRLKWLLEFAEFTGASEENAADPENANAEIAEFTRSFSGFPIREKAITGLRRGMYEKLQRWVKEGRLQINWSELGSDFARVVVKSSRTGDTLNRYQGIQGGFLMACGDLIEREGSRIARCQGPGCDRLFVRRKRGNYCSRRCSQRMRSERFRMSHSREELSEARHQAYKEKVRRESGLARKVSRRPRLTAQREER